MSVSVVDDCGRTNRLSQNLQATGNDCVGRHFAVDCDEQSLLQLRNRRRSLVRGRRLWLA